MNGYSQDTMAALTRCRLARLRRARCRPCNLGILWGL